MTENDQAVYSRATFDHGALLRSDDSLGVHLITPALDLSLDNIQDGWNLVDFGRLEVYEVRRQRRIEWMCSGLILNSIQVIDDDLDRPEVLTRSRARSLLRSRFTFSDGLVEALGTSIPIIRIGNPVSTFDPDKAYEAFVSVSSRDLNGLAEFQDLAAAIYGRMNREKALAWTLEELGELSQAMRREEPGARLAEELGQLTAWMFCLANITEVDLSDAVHDAFAREMARQHHKYGALKSSLKGISQ